MSELFIVTIILSNNLYTTLDNTNGIRIPLNSYESGSIAHIYPAQSMCALMTVFVSNVNNTNWYQVYPKPL